jgi:hypothetical protein
MKEVVLWVELNMINTIVDNKYGCLGWVGCFHQEYAPLLTINMAVWVGLGWVGWLFVVVFTKKYSLKRPFSAKILAFSWDFYLQRYIFWFGLGFLA